jgi:hypothetical protein
MCPIPTANCEPRRGAERSGWRSVPLGALEDTMTTEQKIIRAKIGLLELAKQLGNVSQACKMMGYSRDSFYGFIYTSKAANWPCRKSVARSRC